ncbi:MAG: hypothetical protein AAB538_06255 [Patescibacteria group bacterium]
MVDLTEIVKSSHKQQRYLLLAVVVGLVILAGVWTALLWGQRAPQVREGDSAIITEITLAGLRTPEQEQSENPVLRQQPSYIAGEPLALRITTAEDVHEPIQIGVRLLDKGGGIHDISPSSVEFQPGTSTFCCWRIEKPGTYTLQIFRPEKTVTSLPLRIQPGFSQQKKPVPS